MRLLKLVLLLLSFATLTYSHSILLMVDLESDSTIYIEGGLSTGRIPAGATITLAEKASGRPIWQGPMPDSGNIVLPLPENPYTVTLNLSEGHAVTKSGPLKKSDTTAGAASSTTKDETPAKENKQVSNEDSSTKIITIALLVIAVIIGFVFGFKRK